MNQKETTHALALDPTDRRILSRLQEDARRPISDIAKELEIPATTAHLRLKKMLDQNVIEGTILKLNPLALGFQIQAFVGVIVTKASAVSQVVTGLKKIPQVTEIFYTTGQYSLFLRLWAKSMRDFHGVLSEQIQAIEAIQSTETFIVLDMPLDRHFPVRESP